MNQSIDTVENNVKRETPTDNFRRRKNKKQYPQSGEVMSEGDRIFLLGNNATMPNLQGWSMRDVMYFSKLLKLDLKLQVRDM